jgi:hypothetical protein
MLASDQSWLQSLVLAAASGRISLPIEKGGIEVIAPSGVTYSISKAKLMVQNENVRMYSVTHDGRPLVFKIAIVTENNDVVRQESNILQQLRTLDTKGIYNWFFPEVFESFVSNQQGGRFVNVLGFPPIVENSLQLTPLSKIANEGRVDLKTVVWMYGKLLKVISYCHYHNIANGAITASNVLVETSAHGVVLFDFTHALRIPSLAVQYNEVKLATRIALFLIGGDVNTGKLPRYLMSDPEVELTYAQFLQFEHFFQERLFDGGLAQEAKDSFYLLVEDVWPQRYHEFRTYPRES